MDNWHIDAALKLDKLVLWGFVMSGINFCHVRNMTF